MKRKETLDYANGLFIKAPCIIKAILYNPSPLSHCQGIAIMMKHDRREKTEKFQTFSRPKIKVARTSASGKIYIDYKDTESLKKMISGNGKILSRKRTGATAMEQRMLALAVKQARFLGLLQYVSTAM